MMIRNLFAGIPSDLPEELTEVLTTSPGLRIERIVSRGHRSSDDCWYDQDEREWVLMISGSARLELEGQIDLVELSAGDYFEIPAHLKHRLHWTDPDQDTVWLAIFFDEDPIHEIEPGTETEADKRGDA
jgi:cupin 2 domain-containing protein